MALASLSAKYTITTKAFVERLDALELAVRVNVVVAGETYEAEVSVICLTSKLGMSIGSVKVKTISERSLLKYQEIRDGATVSGTKFVNCIAAAVETGKI
jgi:hypothetical protein